MIVYDNDWYKVCNVTDNSDYANLAEAKHNWVVVNKIYGTVECCEEVLPHAVSFAMQADHYMKELLDGNSWEPSHEASLSH